MNKDILLKNGYRRFNQPNGEPTLYQKRIDDEKGIKYFINCYNYIFPEMAQYPEAWAFKLQTESSMGTVNTTLFNSEEKIKQIELFMECTWRNYGSKYYELFAVSESDVK